jgi:cytochrome c peroxidase
MANTPAKLLTTINASANYQTLFKQITGRQHIELHDIYTALAAFEASLISLNSRYDWYAHGVSDALDANEIAGLNVFRSFVARCAECHTPPLFTNQQVAVLGVPEGKGAAFDVGNEAVSGEKTQRGGFKVPSLRNIALTAPYTHSGAFDNLHDMVKFYTKGRGHAVPKDQELLLHWHIWEPQLSDKEIDQVVAFLQTLTDTSFLPEVPRLLPSGLAVTLVSNEPALAQVLEKKQ